MCQPPPINNYRHLPRVVADSGNCDKSQHPELLSTIKDLMMNTENTGTPKNQMESIKLDNLLINFTTDFQRIWDNRANLKSTPGSFWRPVPAPDLLPGFFPLGDLVVSDLENINGKRVVAVVREADAQGEDSRSKAKALSRPDDFEQVWRNAGSTDSANCTIWRPIPPDGYVALGLVCANDRDKPSLNSVRCVRADLVIASHVRELIWSDKSSGARQDLSAWSIHPPQAAAGEIYFSAGTFVGSNSYIAPDTHAAFSLRMQIALQTSAPPVIPTLSGYQSPKDDGSGTVIHVARLPWFALFDPGLTRAEQFRVSPYYRLERADRYTFIGHAHNTDNVSRTFRWTALRVQRAEKVRAFSHATMINVETEWPHNSTNLANWNLLRSEPIKYSARLNEGFVHSHSPTGGWNPVPFVEVIASVGSRKAVALYQLQSDYRLFREDGTQVVSDLSYTDGESLHLSEYPPEKACEASVPPAPLTELPGATDTAP